MINSQQMIQIEQIARVYFEGASVCHDWSHVQRVKNLALSIGQKESANLQVLEVATLLHDIGRNAEFECKGKNADGTKYCHATEGTFEAKKILENFDLEQKELENILHCIKTHRFRNDDKPETIEAKVLFDADKLDSIGAIGVARTFVFAGHFNTALYSGKEKEIVQNGKNYDFTKDDTAVLEYEKKLKYVKNKMQTKTGKKIANERHEFMVRFFERFWDEVDGEK